MTLRWTQTALDDLEPVHAYIAQDNVEAAADTIRDVVSAIEALKRQPEMGRKGRVAGTRELVVTPYVVAYRVRRDALEICAIIHGARRWPASF